MMPSATPPERAEKCFLRHHDQGVNGDAHDDRRHTVEHVGGEADHVGQTLVAAELRDVDAAGNADGHAHETGDGQQDARSEDGIGHPAANLTHRFRYLGKESEIERTGALEEEIGEDGNQRRHDQDGAAHGSNRRQVVHHDAQKSIRSPGA